MTVSAVNTTAGPFDGNGVADTFNFTFDIHDKSQVRVLQTDDMDVQVALVVDVDYTVAGVGSPSGGSITLLAGPLPVDYVLYIRSDYKETQLTDLESQGGFFPVVHEDALDKLTYLVQQLRYTIDRSISFDDDLIVPIEVNIDLPLPEPDKAIGWDDLGENLINVDVTGQLGDATAIALAAAAAASASADKAMLWAEEDYTVEVEPGLYSAKHWSTMSMNWSQAGFNVQVEPGLYSAFHWSTVSMNWSDKAMLWAEEAYNTEVEPGLYSARHWSTMSMNWSEEQEDVPVAPGEFSSYHWAQKAAASAASVPTAGTSTLPFVKTNGAAGNILLIEALPGVFELPFFLTNGTQDNVPTI